MRHAFHENVNFCPRCGVRSLLRDDDRIGSEPGLRQTKNGTEWWCTTCGFSFLIQKSHKWYIADELHRHDRQVRTRRASDNTTPAIRDAFVGFLESGVNQALTGEAANGDDVADIEAVAGRQQAHADARLVEFDARASETKRIEVGPCADDVVALLDNLQHVGVSDPDDAEK